MGEGPEVFAIACAIARYVSANPRASDTAEGIYRWWPGADEGSMGQLVRALDWMKEQGLMEEHFALDGRARYRRSAKEADLQRMLEDCAGMSAMRH
jgi:Fe2+ or Zn2+ uptake regulation protein